MKRGQIMYSTYQRPLLIVGGCDSSRLGRLRGALDVVMAQPGRWHSGWIGQQVYSLIMMPTTAAGPALEDWAQSHRLPVKHSVVTIQDAVDLDIWGALLIDRTERDLEIAQACIQNGVPTLFMDCLTMELIEVTQADISEWLSLIHDVTSRVDLLSSESNRTAEANDSDEKSHFLMNSVTLPMEPQDEDSAAGRNGDRCAFSQSQAAKVG